MLENCFPTLTKNRFVSGAFVHFVDYGNDAFSSDLRKLPENLQKIKPFAISCSLESKNGFFSPHLIERFAQLSVDDAYEMRYVGIPDNSSPAIVQLFEDGVLFEETAEFTKSINDIETVLIDESDKQFHEILESNKQFDDILETMSKLVTDNLPDELRENAEKPMKSEIVKFDEPLPLNDDDFVIIRYIDSPKLFCVQQTKNISVYNDMMDRLLQFCMTAPSLGKPEIGMACAVRFKNHSEWYRAEIVNLDGSHALTRFVDYGIIVTVEANELKEIGSEFLIIPKQAVPCCLLGFESIEKSSRSSQDLMEFLAEKSNGERRNFRVKIHGLANGNVLVNLTDESEVPTLDLSMRMLELSLPRDKFLEYKKANLTKNPEPQQANGKGSNQEMSLSSPKKLEISDSDIG